MHAKGEFPKLKGSICKIPIETANICNISPRPAVCNRSIIVKLKWDHKYKSNFELVPPCIMY